LWNHRIDVHKQLKLQSNRWKRHLPWCDEIPPEGGSDSKPPPRAVVFEAYLFAASALRSGGFFAGEFAGKAGD
jgi:hypothetical protein